MNDVADDGKQWKPHPDVFVGAALLAFCSIVFWNTTTFREVPAMLSQNVPPTFFPRLVLAVIASLSVALVVSGAKRRWERDPKKVSPRIVLTAVVITAIVALVPRLGTLTTVGVASIVLPVCWGERRAWRVALLAVGLPLSVYLIFVLALGMRLPRGILP